LYEQRIFIRLDLEVYCGKNDTGNNEKFDKCPLGSRVVTRMLQQFFLKVNQNEISNYHIYFDRFFTSPDLMVHLQKLGLRAIGTLRDNCVFTKDMFTTSEKKTKF